MRVVSGTAKGRALKAVPGKGTRPTTDKVKEAIFSSIGPYFDGGRVLDLFAGTGGLGIEALSRGMEQGIFVDMERASIQVVQDNLRVTGLSDKAEVYRNEATRAVKALAKRAMQFALVFLDPPYKLKHMDQLIEEMEAAGILDQACTIVVEHDAEHDYPERIGRFVRGRHTAYGDTAVTIYKSELDEREE